MRVLTKTWSWKNNKEPYKDKLEWVRVKDGDELSCLTLIHAPGYDFYFRAHFKNENSQIRHSCLVLEIL